MNKLTLVLCDECNCPLNFLPHGWINSTLEYFNITLPQYKELESQGEQQ